jgi:NADH:ubiquinone oxidoreductase subunit E
MEQISIAEIIAGYQGKRTELVSILAEIQDKFGYLPKDAVKTVADFLKVNEGTIYSVASFYTQFRLTPLGKNRITVCRGTACHIRGAPKVLDEIEHKIGIKEGETSADMEYTLESVACIGCCALAPCIEVNGEIHGDVTREKVPGLLNTKGATDAR